MRVKTLIREFGIITLGMGLGAVGIYFFLLPRNIVFGSVTGLAMVLSKLLPFSVATLTYGINILCLFIGIIMVGKEFGGKTIYASLCFSTWLYLLETVFAVKESITGDFVLDGIIGIIILSVGQALTFHVGASSGGVDILAKIMNKYLHMEIGTAITIIGTATVVCAGIVYSVRTMIIGFLVTYVNGVMINVYISGFSRKKRVCILSDYTEEIKDFIVKGICRGVTMYPATGGYRNEKKMELVTIVNNNEYTILVQKIREIDERAFVTVSSVSEVLGVWNRKAYL